MSGNTYGRIFTITTFGESHGGGIGVVVDGVTPGIPLCPNDIQKELDRRRPGQSAVTTPRNEADQVQILSGIFEDQTTGTPIMMLIINQDQRSKDYANIAEMFRPGHADFTYDRKYGIRDYRGGGRASGRGTAACVAAGAIAKKLLAKYNINITAFTAAVGGIAGNTFEPAFIERNPVRAADPQAAPKMEALILQAVEQGDSVGGIIECRISGVPAGLGEPVFDKLDAELAKAVISLGGIKAIEFGTGFAAAAMRGSQHNDPITPDGFTTNNAGGILGGISNGDEIVFRAAVKPTSSISLPQPSITRDGTAVTCETVGRHDPCLCPRIVPVIEAMSAIVLIDMLKQQAARFA
ncbi:MAG: chorismate synthase [Victivallaceae bacterium]|nr:chorismate synthase [Victivallaceae bacterium]